MTFNDYKDWYRRVRKKDIINQFNNFLSLEQLKVIFNIKYNVLEYQSVLWAIPVKWKVILKNKSFDVQSEKRGSRACSGLYWLCFQILDLRELSSIKIYRCLLHIVTKQPTADDNWISQLVLLQDAYVLH